MKPALSVIFFTVSSGAGYGLWCLLGGALAAGIWPATRAGTLVPLAFGFVLVTAGLLASTSHLGHPERAWRALTQWKSSWLSREGIASLVTYLPMLALAWLAFAGSAGAASRIAGALLVLGALITLICTANIYYSLKTIRAWRMPQVVPLYLMFALLSGGSWLRAWFAFTTDAVTVLWPSASLMVLAVIVVVVKRHYWRVLDRAPTETAGHATGLERLGDVRAFESPATEESYLTREMAFALARRHAKRLRRIALALFGGLPVAAGVVTWCAWPFHVGWVTFVSAIIAGIAALGCLAGLFVERWLFFAEARHAVAAYFPQRRG